MKVLLSIKPEFVEKILLGEKKFEYRKRIFKQHVDTVVVYATMPVGKVVGEFKIDDILTEDLSTLWLQTKKYSGITKEFFDSYFTDKEYGYAIKFSNFKEYNNPLDLNELSAGLKAPQSFTYL